MTIALVTGANKGLGRQTVKELAAAGWTVYLGSRDADRGKAAAADLDGDVRPLTLDVTSDESVAAAVAAVPALDVLVNNAGVAPDSWSAVDVTQPGEFLGCYGVNVFGPVRVTAAFLPLLRRSANPVVVNVSSGLGSLGIVTDPERMESAFASLIYPSSKAALNMLTVQYAKALPELRVNAVDPGYTATDLNGHAGTQTLEEGARVIVAMAMIGPDGPTGGFFADRGPIPW